MTTGLTTFLEQLHVDRPANTVVVATMSQAFLWPTISDSAFDLCYVAPMGSAASVGLGLALARPDQRVVVLDGDGSILMNLGALVTIGGLAPTNLTHLVVADGGYAITGGQPLPGRGIGQLRELAQAADYRLVYDIADPGALATTDLDALWRTEGPVFVTAEVEPFFDRTALYEQTHSAQASRTQGPAGYHNLRQSLASLG